MLDRKKNMSGFKDQSLIRSKQTFQYKKYIYFNAKNLNSTDGKIFLDPSILILRHQIQANITPSTVISASHNHKTARPRIVLFCLDIFNNLTPPAPRHNSTPMHCISVVTVIGCCSMRSWLPSLLQLTCCCCMWLSN